MSAHTREEWAELYRRTHDGNSKRFLGYTTKLYVEPIRRLIEATGAASLLDYGCGKGYQYLGPRRIHERWGGLLPHCYDPGVVGLNEAPQRRFDGVICCDVMEHIPEHLLPEVLPDIFGYAEKFVLLGIATVTSHKLLADGTNSHCTVRPAEWWMETIRRHAPTIPALRVHPEQPGDREIGRSGDRQSAVSTSRTHALTLSRQLRWEAWFTDECKIARQG